MRPATRATPDEWARKNRVYPPTAGVPGPRDPALTPYIIPPIRAVHARTHPKVVLVCAAQMGKSDGTLDIIGQRFDTAPVPTLYLGPTKQFLQDQWEPRIAELLEETPALRPKVARGKKWKQLRKLIAGVPLRLAHGGSSAAIKSDPFGLALTDEADELMANVKGAGDPIRLVDRRGDTYADFVHYITSTPSEGPSDVEHDPESGLEFWADIDPAEISSTIWRLWQAGTRYHWAWPCPHCGEYFIPRFKCLVWEKPIGPDGRELKSDPALAARTARLQCPLGCADPILDEHKADMNAAGVYVAPGQKVLKSGRVVGAPPDSTTLSYWVSGLASPFKSFGERAADYVEAVRSGDPDEIQAVVNGSMGELYAPGAGDVPEWRELERLKDESRPYVMGQVPEWVRFLTLACDVQKDRLIYGVRGWGARSTSCLIEIGQLFGNTADEDVWDDLEMVLLDRRGDLPIKLALIDSGFRPGNPKQVPENRVYSFCQRHSRAVRPTKGRDTMAGAPIRPAKIEAQITWRGKFQTVGIELFHLDTDYFKRMVHERLRWPTDEPGAFYLPDDVPDYYLQQLVSEARIKKPGGKPVWVQRTRENHFFDIEAMQAAAGWFLGAQRIPDQAREKEKAERLAAGIGGAKKPKKSFADYSAALNG